MHVYTRVVLFCVVIEGACVLQEIKKFVRCFAVESARILSQCLGLTFVLPWKVHVFYNVRVCTFVLPWKVHVFCNVRVCTLCCRGKRTYSAMSGFVLCVAVESARILQAVSKFVSFVAGEKRRYGDVCPLSVLLW